jgi:tripartite-type tricarboxylate transporter receptor subunit TctC
VDIVAQATPNGNTLLIGPVGAIAINPARFRNFQVDPIRDLTCLGILADGTPALVSPASMPVKSVKEFIDYAKARPGKMNYGAANPFEPRALRPGDFCAPVGHRSGWRDVQGER